MKKIRAFIGIILVIGISSLFTGFRNEVKSLSADNTFRRGIVVYPSDIVSVGSHKLIEFMRLADLNLLGIHSNTPSENLLSLKAFLRSNEGQLLIKECKKQHISIEFESHALQEILPRELFIEHPEYFRKDEHGERQKKYNMCFTSEGAFKEIKKNILELTKWLKPTSHRYFFWTDDVKNSFCNCDSCKKYTESEQALLYENKLLLILHKIDPLATLAHLAYGNTYKAPLKIKPSDGIFLEYAPISRDYTKPLSEEYIQNLKNNLQVFPKNTTHILEYWLDASMFSKWRRNNVVKVPWKIENCDRDMKLYNNLGISSVTCFATWMINNDYLKNYGEDSTRQIIFEYGSVLNKYLK
jgi:hypothetical protein